MFLINLNPFSIGRRASSFPEREKIILKMEADENPIRFSTFLGLSSSVCTIINPKHGSKSRTTEGNNV